MLNTLFNQTFLKKTAMPCSAQVLFNWHESPGAFEMLTPPWEPVTMVNKSGGIENGARVVLELSMGPIKRHWISKHQQYEYGKQFCDVQESGPFAEWKHTHRCVASGPTHSFLEDDITYKVPFGLLGAVGGNGFVQQKLVRMFRYRHAITHHAVLCKQAWNEKPGLKVLVAGNWHSIAKPLAAFLSTMGQEVTFLADSRQLASSGRPPVGFPVWGLKTPWLLWDPENPEADKRFLNNLTEFDAIVYFAESVLPNYSRHAETENHLFQKATMAHAQPLTPMEQFGKVLHKLSENNGQGPATCLFMSTSNGYGDRAQTLLDDSSALETGINALKPGRLGGLKTGNRADWSLAMEAVAADWQAIPFIKRFVKVRCGHILVPERGLLAALDTALRTGITPEVLSYSKFWSWISLADLLGGIYHLLRSEAVQGPINLVSPQAVQQDQFLKTLLETMKRPSWVSCPEIFTPLLFPVLKHDGYLNSLRMDPRLLLQTGYNFGFPDLKQTLQLVYGLPFQE